MNATWVVAGMHMMLEVWVRLGLGEEVSLELCTHEGQNAGYAGHTLINITCKDNHILIYSFIYNPSFLLKLKM